MLIYESIKTEIKTSTITDMEALSKTWIPFTFFLNLFTGNSWSGACLNTALIVDFQLKWSAA